MEPQRWQEIDGIFAAALERDAAERPAFLAKACGGDEALRSEVESLLAHVVPEGLVEGQALEEATRLLGKDWHGSQITSIGPYQIVRLLGAGGMGEVYLAHDQRLNRPVAVKLISHYSAAGDERIRRFRQEALAASALNHPNILTIYEVGDSEGQNFIATEFIDGITLRSRMNAGSLPPELALDIAIQVGSAAAAAHAAGIIHRDLKPENVMLRADGLVKVLDFGVAKFIEADDHEQQDRVDTAPGKILGTVTYMSPEQARGLPVDARTDIWSLGAMLYEIVAGQAPFRGETVTETLSLILQKQPAPVARYAADVSAELERIIGKALTKDREERYQTAKDMVVDLRNLKRKREVEAELERSVVPKPQPTNSAPSVAATVLRSGPTAVPSGRIHSASSAEYVVSGIKQHKRAAMLLAVAVFFIGVAVFGAYLYSRKREVAIESIAVMPFVNESGNSDVEYLSDGMTDTLINSLSQLPNLSVKGRTSVFRYKGKDIEPQRVASELSVQAILNGRVVQHGADLTLYLSLVDARNGNQIWGEQYDRRLSQLVSLQNEIARDVSSKLRARLSGIDEQKLAKNYTANAEAYQAYLKGRFYSDKNTESGLKKGIEYFNQAIEIDPNYALAWAGLAYGYWEDSDIHVAPDEVMPKAKEAAMKAIALDDALAEGHGALAIELTAYDWDWPGAEKEFKRAIELNPDDPTSHSNYGWYLSLMGRADEAIAESRRAVELEPLSTQYNHNLGLVLFRGRQPDQAVAQFRKTLELDPNHWISHTNLGWALISQGKLTEAITELQRARQIDDNHYVLAALGQAYALSGNKNEAFKTVAQLKGWSKQRYVSPHSIALVYAGLGEKDLAFECLEKAIAAHSEHLGWLKVDPRMDSLRSDPRFTALLRRLSL